MKLRNVTDGKWSIFAEVLTACMSSISSTNHDVKKSDSKVLIKKDMQMANH